MDFAVYSVGIILGFSVIRWLTENIKFHIRNNVVWVHHWILAFVAMIALFFFEIGYPFLWGTLTGVALEGLGRKNWSIRRK
jgi:hypothetical protein